MSKIVHAIRKIIDFYMMFGLRGLFLAILHKYLTIPKEVDVSVPGLKNMVTLRLTSSDFFVFKQIFFDMEYSFDVIDEPKIIIDAGANIGLSAIYFANKYPKARIIALEPEESNFILLKKNTASYQNIVPVQCALWRDNVQLNLVCIGGKESGYQTQSVTETSKHKICHGIQAINVEKLMQDYKIDYIDVLKMDIETAEKEVFDDAAEWIDKVGLLIVELHDWLKTGCSRSFYNATNNFEQEWRQGENVYLARTGKVTCSRTL